MTGDTANYVPMRDPTSPTTGVMPADLAPAYDPRLTPEMQRAMRDMNSRVPPEPSIPSSYGYDPRDWQHQLGSRISAQYGPGAGMQGATRVMPATGQAQPTPADRMTAMSQRAFNPMVQSMVGGAFGGGLGGLIDRAMTGDQVRASRAANAENVSRINVPPMPPMNPGYSYSPLPGAQMGVRQPLVPTMPPNRSF
jgi:hypothetical protein